MTYTISSPFPAPEQAPYRVQPVEMVPPPTPMVNAETAARAAYADRGSYGEMLHRMFLEMDANPQAYDVSPRDVSHGEMMFGQKDRDAFQDVMEGIYDGLKSSDIVNDFRFHGKQVESEHDVAGVFQAYERALKTALEKSDLTVRQEAKLRHAAQSELDFSLRDVITRHALAGVEAGEPTFDPTEYLLILNPKLRKVDYMDTKEILGVLRRSASLESKDRLKDDLRVLEHSPRPEATNALTEFTNTH